MQQLTLLVYLACLSTAWSFVTKSTLLQSTNALLASRDIRTSLQMSTNIYSNFDALLFDCDGVIAETERDVHRITFNKAFSSMGLDCSWSIEEYGELLKIGGGKERMTKYFNDVGFPSQAGNDKSQFVKDLHIAKTKLFKEVISGGTVPLRPGVARLMNEALINNMPVAVCSTSSEDAVNTVVLELLGSFIHSKIQIFAGDVVAKKKPSPDIYQLAAKTLNVDASRCWVVEDSEIGLHAAKSAGMKCLVTKSFYTNGENFDIADIVVNNLDEGLDGKITLSYLDYKASSKAYKPPQVAQNAAMFGADPDFKAMTSKILGGQGSPFGM